MDLDLLATLLGGHPGLLTGILLAIGLASIADALLPVPAPTSPWYRARKLISTVASNVKNARNAVFTAQPTALTGIAGAAAIVGTLVQSEQPAAPTAAAAAAAPAAGETHGDAILGLLTTLRPDDPAAYAATMARIADVARQASGAPSPAA
ncbi:hypothetical protein GBZ48_31570 [Azospirillum melinis]|uniref:Uncharacterized protein n=1 Tax=Azospirillum melinis TaxID=328839 RepID=A0ABX2KT65_9PROT|nr:hypothetical protein [Azospirillum melinis]MBP2310483.1 hypothetical protein [Azospirillum melinis]NUB03757.1 hypothetical protein [Azospirillum melinis]